MENNEENLIEQLKKMEEKLHVASSPHMLDTSLTTKKMMRDVLIALIPVVGMALYVFKIYALIQLAICILSCLVFEEIFTYIIKKPYSLNDLSAVVTGAILALSLPASAPWYVGVIASLIAIGMTKILFGGLGQNIFNPAMVGRAFVMICFPAMLGAGAYIIKECGVDILTQATPLTMAKQLGTSTPILSLLIGNTNGSLGETSAFACIIGGIYLCIRRTASYEIPLSFILSILIIGGAYNFFQQDTNFTVFHHLFSGALLFGAFFIATDPVTSPLSKKGKYIFGFGLGFFVMVIRFFSGYPEGVMFAVLIMNSIVPLINRITIPFPEGGPTPLKKQ